MSFVRYIHLPLLLFAAVAATVGAEGPQGPPRAGSVVRIKVHAKSLEGNLAGDSADRDVSIYLPPSYNSAAAKSRRFPVIYFLHGFTDSDDKWFGLVKHWINLPETLNRAFAQPGAREAIVVMPNAYTAFAGSMYSSSPVTGDWETFVARELVAWVDAHYRTIPSASSRALAGHSMGGYGTLRVGLKNPGTFSALYAMSPCCLAPNPANRTMSAEVQSKLTSVSDKEALAKADFMTKAMYASAAAWSPNPQRPPFFIDLPWKDGVAREEILAKWEANAPLRMLDQHIATVRGLRGFAVDSGDKDMGIAPNVKAVHALLESYQVPHLFEIYDGDHLNRIASRIEGKVVPFFSERLDFGGSNGRRR